MTPKDKAVELIDKMMYEIKYNCQPTLSGMVAKKCALIAVDEIISIKLLWFQKETKELDYWKEVKQEIENL